MRQHAQRLSKLSAQAAQVIEHTCWKQDRLRVQLVVVRICMGELLLQFLYAHVVASRPTAVHHWEHNVKTFAIVACVLCLIALRA